MAPDDQMWEPYLKLDPSAAETGTAKPTLARPLADLGINPRTLKPWRLSEETTGDGLTPPYAVGGVAPFTPPIWGGIDSEPFNPMRDNATVPVEWANRIAENARREVERLKLQKFLRFVPDALTAAAKSKDSTKVGCVILDDDYCVRSSGWNGFARGVQHRSERDQRPKKYMYSAHAEENAIAQAARTGVSLKGCTLIVTALYPCSTCARLIIQSGIKTVLAPDVNMPERWATEWVVSKEMFAEAGVQVYAYDPENNNNIKVIV